MLIFISSGHRIVINGQEVKARTINSAKKVWTKSQPLYSICTEKHNVIQINGLSVVSYGVEEWLTYANNNNIFWRKN